MNYPEPDLPQPWLLVWWAAWFLISATAIIFALKNGDK